MFGSKGWGSTGNSWGCEARRRLLVKAGVGLERKEDIAHLRQRPSISPFVRHVNDYFRFFFASPFYRPTPLPFSSGMLLPRFFSGQVVPGRDQFQVN
jgi:hypothetical protein